MVAAGPDKIGRDRWRQTGQNAVSPSLRSFQENKDRLHHCLTPEGCPVVPPVHELHLAEHLKVPIVTEGLSPKEALAVAIKRSEGLVRFYQSLVELQPEGEIRRRLEYLARTESGHKEKLEDIYDTIAFPEVW